MTRHTGYRTRVQAVDVPHAGRFVIRSLLDRQQYHDPAGRAARVGISSALWPLFGLLWPSAIHLASHLALRPVDPAERILEIGCGLALASLVAHQRGACMTASDRHPMVPLFLHENLKLNRLPPRLRYRHGQWGLDAPPTRAQVGCTVLCDRYDLIVGSDLLYQRDAPQTVAAFIDQHARRQATVWLVDADRGYRPAFNRQMAAHGFALEAQVRLGSLPPPRDQAHYKGRLLKYQRTDPDAGTGTM